MEKKKTMAEILESFGLKADPNCNKATFFDPWTGQECSQDEELDAEQILSFTICNSELYADAKKVRDEVFVKELGEKDEFEEIDKKAKHAVCYSNKRKPIATARIYYSEQRKCHVIDKVAVLKEFRKLGKAMRAVRLAAVSVAKEKGETRVGVESPLKNKPYFEDLGFEAKGEPYLKDGKNYVWMDRPTFPDAQEYQRYAPKRKPGMLCFGVVVEPIDPSVNAKEKKENEG